jgi:hypothetical protein
LIALPMPEMDSSFWIPFCHVRLGFTPPFVAVAPAKFSRGIPRGGSLPKRQVCGGRECQWCRLLVVPGSMVVVVNDNARVAAKSDRRA